MIDDEEESNFIGWGIKKTSEDKLTYKNIIADAINWCRKLRGKIGFKDSVEGLADVIEFNVPGYKLSKKLEEIRNNLDIQREDRKQKAIDEQGISFYKNANRAKFRLAQGDWYWNEYFKKIIQLLADHNLLFETEKMTKVRIKRPDGVDDGTRVEESVSDLYKE